MPPGRSKEGDQNEKREKRGEAARCTMKIIPAKGKVLGGTLGLCFLRKQSLK